MDIIDTQFELVYDLYDTTAADDSSFTTTGNADIADITKLAKGTQYGGCMTLEHNFSVLEGSLDELPTNTSIAFFSDQKSDISRGFSTNPKITIQFSEPHSMIGVELNFAQDYPKEAILWYYNADGDCISKKKFKMDGLHNILFNPVANFMKMIIEFTSTYIPYRSVKINKLVYGIQYIWGEDVIIDSTMVTESDIIADKVSIDTLKFSIFDKGDYFNLGNQNGLHPYIQSNQLVDCYEYIRGDKIYLGRKFMDTFSSDRGKITFNTISYMGLLDKIDYHIGDVYTGGVKAGILIDSIMQVAGVTDYKIDQEVYDILLYGTLKSGTCRACLREVLFATQASVTTWGLTGVKIYKRTDSIQGSIGIDRKISTKVTKKDYISGVEVKYYSYDLDTSSEGIEDIVKGIYSEGNNLIKWDAPHSNITTSTGTITKQGKYYCILHLSAAQASNEIVIQGRKYIESKLSAYKKVDYLDAGETENIKSYSGTLLNGELAKSVADQIFAYHKYRLQLDIKYLANLEKYDTQIRVENSDSRYNDYISKFEKISYDLTRGYVATATLVGYYNIDDGGHYSDSSVNTDLVMLDNILA